MSGTLCHNRCLSTLGVPAHANPKCCLDRTSRELHRQTCGFRALSECQRGPARKPAPDGAPRTLETTKLDDLRARLNQAEGYVAAGRLVASRSACWRPSSACRAGRGAVPPLPDSTTRNLAQCVGRFAALAASIEADRSGGIRPDSFAADWTVFATGRDGAWSAEAPPAAPCYTC